MRARTTAGGLLLLAAPVFAQGPVPVGSEITITPADPGGIHRPSVAADDTGRFVVVWDTQEALDGSFSGVFAQRFDSSGVPLGTTFQVNVYTTGNQRDADVAADSAGGFVVVWRSYPEAAVSGRRYDAAGNGGPDFRINTTTLPGAFVHPSVAMNDTGNFVVTWVNGFEVLGQRYDAAGVAQGGEFRVSSHTTEIQQDPRVAIDAAGNFVVVWTTFRSTGSYVVARRFDATGVPAGGNFEVSGPVGTSTLGSISVAMAGDGRFVVAWTDVYAGCCTPDNVVGRRFDATGAPIGNEFTINSYTTDLQRDAAVASDDEGNFVVAWQSHFQDGPDLGVFAQAFDATGAPVGGESQINTYTRFDQYSVAIASAAPGYFVTTWNNGSEAGYSGRDIRAQRIGPDLIFRDGVEAGDLSAWSASSSDGGDLAVSGSAAMGSTALGLAGTLDDTNGLYVEDASPAGEKRYRARFYLDPNGFDPGEGEGHNRIRTLLVFSDAPTRRVAAVVLRRIGSEYSVMGRARLDDDSQADTGFFPISDGPHAIEIDLGPASGPDTFDGTFEIWVDGVSVGSRVVLDNYLAHVDFVRMGALSVKSGASGTIYWDEFESRRASYIGLLP